jgi:hypothetical protein
LIERLPSSEDGEEMELSRHIGVSELAGLAVTVPVKQFSEQISGIGLTKTYELINSGELQSITVGKRRLVLLDSWRRYVERHLGTPAETPAAHPPRRVAAAR